MKNLLLVGCCVVSLFAVAGCNNSPADALMTEQIGLLNEMIDAMESGDQQKLTAIQTRSMELAKRAQELKLTPEEEKKLIERYKPQLEQAGKRMQEVMMKKLGGAGGPGGGFMPNFKLPGT